MADPLSVSSALLAVVTAAIQSSKALYDTVRSFQNHQRTVVYLLDELAALNQVLQSLQSLVGPNDTTFASLKLPLERCSQACSEFEGLVIKCSKHSGGARTSFRDWARLRYMGNDITGFTNMIAGYKSTICIALADANLHSTSVTLQVLNEYKDLVQSTTQDLEDHLNDIDAKLRSLASQAENASETMQLDIQRIKNEKGSVEICLQFCNEVLSHINDMHFQPIVARGNATAHPGTFLQARDFTRAETITLSGLRLCSDALSDTIKQLHSERDSSVLEKDTAVEDPGARVQTLEGEFNSAKKCLEICSGAAGRASDQRVHVVEDMKMGHDGQQLFVSTLGDLFDIKGVSAGDRAIQFVGSVSERTLQQYFSTQDRHH